MLLDGKVVAKEIRQNLKKEIEKYELEKKIRPHLVIILVGQVEASLVYVRNKIKACNNSHIDVTLINKEETITENELINLINKYNHDDLIDGIIVQLPLPSHIRENVVINTIDQRKDVDGFGIINKGKLFCNIPSLLPATPKGIMQLLNYYNIELAGKHAVVVGRSNIVGKPIAQLLLNQNATVTICHSKTKNLSEITKQADILIVAIGKCEFIKKEMIKDDVVIVDVGMNHKIIEGNSVLCGDVDYQEIKDKASYITPVPGGVGPMTIASLLENTYITFKENRGKLE